MPVFGNSIGAVGVWGPVTATLDWCEANYQFSKYIAEMTNTMSNLFSIWLALHGAISARKEDLPIRLTIGSLRTVDLGCPRFGPGYSLLLLYKSHRSFYTDQSRNVKSSIVFRDPVYHQVVFGLLVFTTAARTYYLLNGAKGTAKIPAPVRSVIARMFGLGFVLFGVGFIIWNLDNVYCDILTRGKNAVGWPLAFLLEGNWDTIDDEWYHLTLCIKDDYRNYKLGSSLGVPYIQKVSGKKTE
ncbi:hypothetical protein HWV62_20106 [Athelia sp. TMB]|nr:hypothetical protein HWV62_20106 [Athelia sp. TMB]